MRALVSLVLAFCFVSVSALASYDKAEAVHLPNATDIRLIIETDMQAVPADMDAAGQGHDCPCKEKADSLTLTCGVTLALSGNEEDACVFGMERAWYAFGHSDRKAERMYLLRRPPRNVL